MSLDIAHLVGRILVPAAVIAALNLLRKYLPARSTNLQAQIDSNGNVEDFTSANVVVYTCMVVVGTVFALGVHWALAAANHNFARADGPAVFQFFPSPAAWWFFPGFAALCLSWEITLFLWSLFVGRNKVIRFIDWTSERAGYDSTRALRWMSMVVALPIGIATIIAVPMHSTLREKDIVVGHYATLARQSLQYSKAQRLLVVDGFRDRSVKFTPKAAVIIDFDDGSRWNSSDIGDFKSKLDPGLVEFLESKTRLSAEYAETEPDLRTYPLAPCNILPTVPIGILSAAG